MIDQFMNAAEKHQGLEITSKQNVQIKDVELCQLTPDLLFQSWSVVFLTLCVCV